MRKVFLIGALLLSISTLVFAQTPVTQEPGKNIVSGKTVVTTANTPVVLGSDTVILSVTLTWASDSATPYVYVGSSSLSGNNGAVLTSGSVLTLNVDNLNDVYVNSTSANGRVAYVAVVR